jgi:hypothetical protein
MMGNYHVRFGKRGYCPKGWPSTFTTIGKSNSSNYENKREPVNLALTDCILQFEYIK